MLKVQILNTCSFCHGKAYLPIGEAMDARGAPYTRFTPCPACAGSGQQPHWISLEELATLLRHTQCPHLYTSHNGGLRFTAGDVWDDISEVCDDCGARLDDQTINGSIP